MVLFNSVIGIKPISDTVIFYLNIIKVITYDININLIVFNNKYLSAFEYVFVLLSLALFFLSERSFLKSELNTGSDIIF